jgi:hypothetical protein
VKSSRGHRIDLAVAAVIAYDRARATREREPEVVTLEDVQYWMAMQGRV